MITFESAMLDAAKYADDAIHYRNVGSLVLMRSAGLGLCMCEAAAASATFGPDQAMGMIDKLVGGEDERDVLCPRPRRDFA